jgi:hypothetical protein
MARKPKLRVVASNGQPAKPKRTQNWQPTPLERRTIERCMAIGFTAEQAAQVVGKSVDSLQKHCRRELDNGYAKVGAKVGGLLLKKALAGDTACLIFYAKCRLGWNEKQILEHQGRGGGPIQYDAVQADADAFTRRIFQLGERFAAALEAQQPAPAPALIDVTPAPAEPNEIN